jgi:DNA-binding beta-propeller fold protein YncE
MRVATMHIVRAAVVVAAVTAIGMAVAGPVGAAATTARTPSSPGQSCSNPSDAVIVIRVATSSKERVLKVGQGAFPDAIAITPNGKTAYVGNGLIDQLPSATPINGVIPIRVATNSAGRTLLVAAGIKPAGSADAFAFTPDSRTAYVAVGGTYEVDPIRVATSSLGKAISAGGDPGPIIITPNGRTGYVADLGSDTVTPFSTATGRPGKAITVGAELGAQASTAAIAITPNGKTLYVGTNSNAFGEDDAVTPVSTATNRPGKAIRVGQGIDVIAITPNGTTAYVASFNAGTVTPIRLATNTAGRPIGVGTDLGPMAMAITPNGKTAYVGSVATCASAEPPGVVRTRLAAWQWRPRRLSPPPAARPGPGGSSSRSGSPRQHPPSSSTRPRGALGRVA